MSHISAYKKNDANTEVYVPRYNRGTSQRGEERSAAQNPRSTTPVVTSKDRDTSKFSKYSPSRAVQRGSTPVPEDKRATQSSYQPIASNYQSRTQ